MASPQLENGYTRIANELLLALASAGLSGRELSVVLFIARESFGWGDKWTKPGQTSMGLTGGTMSRSSACLAMAVLVRRGIIKRDDRGRVAIVKDFNTWKASSPLDTVQPTGRLKARQVSSPLDGVSSPLDASVQPTGQKTACYKDVKERKKDKERGSGFEIFWKAYPRKVAKVAATRAWAKISPDQNLLGQILAAVGVQSRSAAWTKDNGAFIPHPATWLNGRRWEDEEYRHVGTGDPEWDRGIARMRLEQQTAGGKPQ